MSPLHVATLTVKTLLLHTAAGVDYKNALELCRRYQEHLGESAKIVSNEQVNILLKTHI